MKASMMSDYKGLSYVTELKHIPADKENESVAKGLEYAIADWGVAQVAQKLGKAEDYEYFSKRALAYQNYWDKDYDNYNDIYAYVATKNVNLRKAFYMALGRERYGMYKSN